MGLDWSGEELPKPGEGMLSDIWGMEKFHYFLYGKQFTLETDQKPLVSIYKKHGGDFPKNTETHCEELPIPAV